MVRVGDVRHRPDREQPVVDRREEEVVRAVPEDARGDRPADGSDREEKPDDDRRGNRDTVAPEPTPHLLPVAARLDRADLGRSLGVEQLLRHVSTIGRHAQAAVNAALADERTRVLGSTAARRRGSLH
jgi:hypothetical protein